MTDQPLSTSALRAVFAMLLVASLICSMSIRYGHADTPIAMDADSIEPLGEGDAAPRFLVRTVDGESFDFDPRSLDRPVVLIVFRGGWCPYCNIHLSELRHVVPEISDLDVDVYFVSGDRPDALYEGLAGDTQTEIDGLDYEILSDADANAAIALGIAFRADPGYVQRLRNANKDLAESAIEREGVLPVPAVFAVGTDGRIAYAHVDADFKVRLSADELLAVATELAGP